MTDRKDLIRHLKYCSKYDANCMKCERWDADCGDSRCLEDLMAKAAIALEQQTWIPVSERLPDTWKAVIVCRDFDFPDCISIEWRTLTKEWSNDNAHNPNVTHWMPLPTPPKENADEVH